MLRPICSKSSALDDCVEEWRRSLCAALEIDCEVELTADSLVDTRLVRRAVGALRIIEASGRPMRLLRTGIDNSGLFLVHIQLQGNCVYRERGAEARLGPGSFSLSRVRRAAEIEWLDAFRCVLIGIPESRLTEVCPDWFQLATTGLSGSDGCAAMFVDAVKSLLLHADVTLSASRGIGDSLIALLGAALDEIASQGERTDSRLEAYHRARIHKFIRAELSNPDLDIPLIARSVGLSQRYIHRLFASEPLHLMQSVWSQRLEHCYRELERNHSVRRPVSAIAFAWGFNDPAHFSRVFRKRFGRSPSEVRRQSLTKPVQSHHASSVGTFEQATFHS